MSSFQYIIKICTYIINVLYTSTHKTQVKMKHKNSEDIQSDTEDEIIININNNDNFENTNNNLIYTSIHEDVHQYGKIPHLNTRSKKKKIPTYTCGYCHTTIPSQMYMYSDMIFCTATCRTQYITLDRNPYWDSSSSRLPV